MTEPRILVLIPARMAATRLPGKPLLDIGGLPMIVHVLRRAEEAKIGRVAVATDTPEIAAAVKAAGGEVVMTRADHPSGSDRIHEAMRTIDPDGRAEIVVNLQGDFPTINARHHPRRAAAARRPRRRHRDAGLADPYRGRGPGPQRGEGGRLADRPEPAPCALFHPRHGALWRRPALPPHRPLRLPPRRAGTVRGAAPSPLEQQEKLEQLRALEAGMRIDITLVDSVPRGVDTPADLETARQIPRHQTTLNGQLT